MITMRFAYQVRGVAKFLSHLDLLKLFNRALLRAGLPVAYSEGFNPHARISFGPPRGVGQEGLREYCDLRLKEELPPEEVCRRLDDALPKWIGVIDSRVLAAPAPALMAEINLAVYEVELSGADEALRTRLNERLAAFGEAERAEIVRRHPRKRDRLIDLKAGLQRLELADGKLVLEIPFGEAGSVKPTEVLVWLLGDEAALALPIARTGLFVQDEAGVRRLP